MLELLVEQTNLYFDQFLVAKGGLDNLPRHSRIRSWTPVDIPEMKVFLAVNVKSRCVLTHVLNSTIHLKTIKLSALLSYINRLDVYTYF